MKSALPIMLILPLAVTMGMIGWQLLVPVYAQRDVFVLPAPVYTFLFSRKETSLYLFARNDRALLQLITEGTANVQGEVAVVVHNLTTGQYAALGEHVQMPAASLYKVPVMIAWMARAEEGGRPLDEYTKAQIYRMITVSSNPDGQELGARIGWDTVSVLMKNLGFRDTALTDPPVTSASDMAQMFAALYNRELVSPRYSEEMIRILADQQINDRIPRSLPQGTVVAHKTGEIDRFRHDVGVIEAPHSVYVLAVLGGNLSDPEQATEAIADLSRSVYDYFEQQFTRPAAQVL